MRHKLLGSRGASEASPSIVVLPFGNVIVPASLPQSLSVYGRIPPALGPWSMRRN
ncbi:MAG TPA: hypothetical protein VME69_10380 [Methylocella sp.]|nr:hypothetical protein [Methylocella sp.]